MRRRRAVLLVAALVVLGACQDDQDPQLDTGDRGPSTTSATLGRCPEGGPDETTPPAGCLDEDGRVLRP